MNWLCSTLFNCKSRVGRSTRLELGRQTGNCPQRVPIIPGSAQDGSSRAAQAVLCPPCILHPLMV